MNKVDKAVLIICILIFSVFVFMTGRLRGYTEGYSKGKDAGIGIALDTVYKIIEKQVNNDSTVTHFTIAQPDTVSYFLSAKTIQQH
jgi:hypothetical protein